MKVENPMRAILIAELMRRDFRTYGRKFSSIL
jgi:hypothetical protein